MSEMPKGKLHNLMLENRSRLSLTGVMDVSGFNEETVSAKTCDGTLIVRGVKLHIDKLNLDTGEVSIDGRINSLQYTGGDTKKSRFSRLFG